MGTTLIGHIDSDCFYVSCERVRSYTLRGVPCGVLGNQGACVIAKSYERIHRSNLVGMGVLPLQYKDGQDADSLGLTGTEVFDVVLDDNVKPRQDLTVTATKADGSKVTFTTQCRIDTPVEVDYYRNGGILHTVLRNMAK